MAGQIPRPDERLREDTASMTFTFPGRCSYSVAAGLRQAAFRAWRLPTPAALGGPVAVTTPRRVAGGAGPSAVFGTLGGFHTSRAGSGRAKLVPSHICRVWNPGRVPNLPRWEWPSKARPLPRDCVVARRLNASSIRPRDLPPALPPPRLARPRRAAHPSRRMRGEAAGAGGRVGRSECPKGLRSAALGPGYHDRLLAGRSAPCHTDPEGSCGNKRFRPGIRVGLGLALPSDGSNSQLRGVKRHQLRPDLVPGVFVDRPS